MENIIYLQIQDVVSPAPTLKFYQSLLSQQPPHFQNIDCINGLIYLDQLTTEYTVFREIVIINSGSMEVWSECMLFRSFSYRARHLCKPLVQVSANKPKYSL
ncbi:hypothetical protein TSUD_320230 [Trifolium subterraneum]|uniref:Uncharacterized protein n=1 Tax=Trifolium subterraneum TaxID=3900 RepID=A0A2Z6N499_TRISU|nr:hypothetical protein TSUD_320230 [Trifolium subterraneum]